MMTELPSTKTACQPTALDLHPRPMVLRLRLCAPNSNLALGWRPHADVNPDLGPAFDSYQINEPDCRDRQKGL